MPLKKILKVVLPLFLLAILVWNVISNWGEVSPYLVSFSPFPFAASFILLLFIYPESSLAWYVLVRKMGIAVSFQKAMYVWIVSNTSRYIPGSIWQYIGRVGLGEEAGIKRGQGVASVLAEVFFVLVAGILISLLTLPYWDVLGVKFEWWILLMLFPLLLLHPNISSQAMRLMAAVTKKSLRGFKNKLNFGDSVFVLPWFILNFALNGVALFLLAKSLGVGTEPRDLIMFSGFYAFSWIVGYLTLFAPAGIGAREASLAYLLSLSMPPSLASAIALLDRFLVTAAEVIVFVIVVKLRGKMW